MAQKAKKKTKTNKQKAALAQISAITENNWWAYLRELIQEWRQLKKSKGRDGDKQKERKTREAFVRILGKLWDIYDPNVIAEIETSQLL